MTDKLNSTDIFVGGLENFDGNFRASGSISAGDVLELDGTETGNMPDVSTTSTDGADGIGVAAHDASSGEAVTVLMTGAQARAKTEDGSGANISPGDLLTSTGGTVAGSVNATTGTNDEIVGKALTAEAGGEVVMLVDTGGDAG